jgi:hypothetical protein
MKTFRYRIVKNRIIIIIYYYNYRLYLTRLTLYGSKLTLMTSWPSIDRINLFIQLRGLNFVACNRSTNFCISL